jgi:preprotein translocase subunit SecA
MSGTAKTNEEEFFKVYGLEVSTIPTHNNIKRKDIADSIFQTEKGKLKALTKKVKELHQKGQPVLIGTISIEKNEMISKYLERENVSHNILNAKNHEKEGEIIAMAGKKGAVTIATNMAGRGVDIKLGGPTASEFEKEEVNNLGGLFVIGTERHEARRIDNQLRGRAGRQGDEGSTEFMVSLEDDLMRVFGSDGVKNMMNKFGIPEDMPITSKIVSNALEGAQEKIEGFHFDSRKHTLQYDDVLNSQRKSIYDRRRKVLISYDEELKNIFTDILNEVAENISDNDNEKKEEKKKEFIDFITEKKNKYGEESFYSALKNIYLQIIDQYFMAHLEHMDYIRSSVNLRAYGQRDPLVEYKKEGLITYKAMLEKVKEDLYNFTLNIDAVMQNMEAQRIMRESQMKNSIPSPTLPEGKVETQNTNTKIGRNDPCPCGSDKKVKKCVCKEFEYLRR